MRRAVGMSAKAHARLASIDLGAVLEAPGVVTVLTAADIPGKNDHGPVIDDDPVFAEDLVEYVGQSIFAVVATSMIAARKAARLARIEYVELEPWVDPATALEHESFVLPTVVLDSGNCDQAISGSPHSLSGDLRVGGQDHFYLEGHIALATPREDRDMTIYSSTQHPTEVQNLVARVLGRRAKDVIVECRRMGGGFGGKETQPALIACIAALAAAKTGRPVKLRLDRDDDMMMTGKRHDYLIDYKVGFEPDGRINGIELSYTSRCGRSADLSGPVNDRTLFHADNAYFLPEARITSHRCKTHTVSNTAFRGFGGPQGMMGIEQVLDDIARNLRLDPLDVRRVNFYGIDDRNVTPYGMKVEDNIIAKLVEELEAGTDYRKRRQAVVEFNKTSLILKRGIALTPVKFGISFTATFYNQAGALTHVYRDGTIMCNHGGTEMGQGLFTKVAQVVAEELGVAFEDVKCTATDTSKVPNTSATAASAGSDLNGMAAQAAARQIKTRLAEFAASKYKVAAASVRFEGGHVVVGKKKRVPFAELVEAAYTRRVSLSATGYYRTPKIHYNPKTMRGRPFFYFGYGAAVSEVVVDTLTGEHRIERVDILHDVGRSLNPAIDLGQIEGGFMQGVGWLTSEELCWDEEGRLTTHAPSTYKIPTVTDWPESFNVEILGWGENPEKTIYRSKAVGEPPLMLAMSVFFAIRDAVASVAGYALNPNLHAPATPESVLTAIEALQAANSDQPVPITARRVSRS